MPVSPLAALAVVGGLLVFMGAKTAVHGVKHAAHSVKCTLRMGRGCKTSSPKAAPAPPPDHDAKPSPFGN